MRDIINGTALALYAGLMAAISWALVATVAWLGSLSAKHPEWHVGCWIIGTIAVFVWVGCVAMAHAIRRHSGGR